MHFIPKVKVTMGPRNLLNLAYGIMKSHIQIFAAEVAQKNFIMKFFYYFYLMQNIGKTDFFMIQVIIIREN